jgi:leader peptidase (prepilin peptidase)/N-methyltransferase
VTLLAPLLGALLGAIVGSFVATLVIRWPRGEQAVTGRSRCDQCRHELRWWELVPIGSALWLKGRCSRCGAAIDPLHGGVELAAAAIGAISLAILPNLAGAALALFGWLLLPLGLLDWRHFWLPDRLTIVLAVTGLALGGQFGISLTDRLIGGVAGWATLWLLTLAYRRVRGREGLGAGDAKLLGGVGLWLGWTALPVVLLIAAATGLMIALVRRMKRDDELPFGSMLAVAGWVTGVALVAAYAAGAELI